MSGGEQATLYDTLGPFTGIPNRVIRLWPIMGQEAFSLYVCLRYHAGRDEVIFPSYDLIQKETGLHRRKIAQAVRTLEDFSLIERVKRFSQSTVYKLLYPTPERIEAVLKEYGDPLKGEKLKEYTPRAGKTIKRRRSSNGGTNGASSSNGGTSDSSTVGTSSSSNGGTLTRLINNKTHKNNKTQSITPDGVSVSDERELTPEEILGVKPKEFAPRRSAEEAKASLSQTVNRAMVGKGDERYDLSTYPEGLRAYARVFAESWRIDPPMKPKKGGGQYAFWLQGLMQLQDACGEFGPQAVKEYYERWDSDRRKKGTVPFTVGHPGALVKVVTALVGEKRQGGEKPSGHVDDIITLAKENWPAFLAMVEKMYFEDFLQYPRIEENVSRVVSEKEREQLKAEKEKWSLKRRQMTAEKYGVPLSRVK